MMYPAAAAATTATVLWYCVDVFVSQRAFAAEQRLKIQQQQLDVAAVQISRCFSVIILHSCGRPLGLAQFYFQLA